MTDNQFINSLKTTDKYRDMAVSRILSFGADEKKCNKFCASLISNIKDRYSLKRYVHFIGGIRRELSKLAPNHHLVRAYKLSTKDELAAIKVKEERQLVEQAKDTTVIYQKEVDRVILKGIELLGSSSYIDLAIGLIILTGRRPYEILKTAVFSPVQNNDVYVKFKGQAKKGVKNTSAYEIPVLYSPKAVISALARLRAMRNFSMMEHEHIQSLTSSNINRHIKKHFGADTRPELLKEFKPKWFRALYAVYSYEVVGKARNYALNGWLMEVLGHEGINTSISYASKLVIK